MVSPVPNPRRNGDRESVKRDELIRVLRSRVLRGVWAPGEQLPVRVRLLKEFGTTPVTLQRAMQRLFDEGVLTSAGRRGTFVAKNLPHRTRYALLLNDHSDHPANAFAASMIQAARLVAARRDLTLLPIQISDCRNAGPDLEPLYYQVRNQLFAGLIFSVIPFIHEHTPLLTAPDMPRVMFINPESRRYPEIMRITNDFQTLLERSLRCLSELRPREPVLLLPTAPFRDSALKLLPRYGLSCREEHALTLSSGQAALAPELVRLLWARDRRIRPDAIFVGDDNVLSLLLPALLDWLGPEEAAKIRIVSHANFPLLRRHELPVHFFGYNLEWFLERAVELIDGARNGVFGGPLQLPVEEREQA